MAYVPPSITQPLPPQIPTVTTLAMIPPWKHSLLVTSIKRLRNNTVEITVSSNKASDGNIFYYWFIDGVHQTTTNKPSWTFYLLDNDSIQIDIIDHTSPDMDVSLEAPAGYPARHTVYWNPPAVDADVKTYRIRTRKDAGSWTVIAYVDHIKGKWNYFMVTPPLDDGGSYEIDVAAIDESGNPGSTVASDAFTVLRIPDGDPYVPTYSEITNKFTFASV